MRNIDLSLNDSLQLKGIALLLLLCHHLFYIQNGQYDDFSIAGVSFVQTIGQICKVCVALFVFLSGYGLMASIDKSQNFKTRNFYVKGFTKLYLNYWVMWLFFVPIGVFIFKRTFNDVYQPHVGLKWFVDFIGFSNAFDYWGYNVTWWFYSCILILYLLFPLIRFLMETKYALLALVFSFAFMKLPYIFFLEPIKFYLFAFVLGIYFAKKQVFKKINGEYSLLLISLTTIVLFSIWRQFGFFMKGIFVDPFLALFIILLFRSLKSIGSNLFERKIGRSLHFIGKHSFNIFLFHTFIFYYYFQYYIYYLRNPFLIFFLLLGVCFLLSIFIEYFKKRIGFYRLQEFIIDKLSVKSL